MNVVRSVKTGDDSSVVTHTLGSGNLRDAVRLPDGEDLNEWLAVNISDLYNQVCMLYGIIVDHCTEENCPRMTAGGNHEYYWEDSMHRPLDTPAPVYIGYLLTGVQAELDNENVFPSQIGKPFQRHFRQICEQIICRLFRVYAHVYHAHEGTIAQLQATPHLNTSFKHFILFSQQFHLIPTSKMAPLAHIIEQLASSS